MLNIFQEKRYKSKISNDERRREGGGEGGAASHCEQLRLPDKYTSLHFTLIKCCRTLNDLK